MTSSGWTRQHRCEYRQTTVQEPWGATLRESWEAAQNEQPDVIVINVQFACRARPGPEGGEARDFYARLNDRDNGLYEQVLAYRTNPGRAFLGPDSVFQSDCENYFTNLAKINPEIRIFRRVSTIRPRTE